MNTKLYLSTVTPVTLKHQLWLKRDKWFDVFSDLLKGDLSNQKFFRHSQFQKQVQAILFTGGWVTIGLLMFEFFRYSLNGFQSYVFPISPDTFDPKHGSPFLVAASLVYWNFSKKYGDQWTYCAGVFNKIFYDRFPAINPEEHLFRKATFAIDLIDCNLWHHKSFFTDFNYILECSIKHSANDPIEEGKVLERFRSGAMKISNARALIARFQNDLENRIQSQSVIAFEESKPKGSKLHSKVEHATLTDITDKKEVG